MTPFLTFQYGPKAPITYVSIDQPAPTVMAHGIGGCYWYQAFIHHAGGGMVDPETGESLDPLPSYRDQAFRGPQ